MKKPQHPQAKAAARKQLASHGGGGGSGGAAPAKPSHPNAKAAKSVKARAASKKKTAAAAHKPRKWSPDEGVALCSARAVAEAVRLLSGRVLDDADVLGLYWTTAHDPDEGQTLSDALTAAQRKNPAVAGFSYGPAGEHGRGPRLVTWCPGCVHGAPSDAVLILGLDLPDGQSHAVVAHEGTWWSWGEPHTPADFPGAVIEEAWLICAG